MGQPRSAPKKEQERRLLDAFLKLSCTDGVVEVEGESPDFILLIDNRHVGVELTEIHVPNDDDGFPLKARESLATKVVNEARRAYEAAGGVPLHVAVGFTPRADLRTTNRSATAKALAKFLLRQSVSSATVSSWNYSEQSLPSQIQFVNAYAVPGQAAHWYAPQAGWVVPLTGELLQASIDEKAQLLTDYRLKAQEIWLVLAVAGGAPSQGFDFRHHIDARTITSPFDRTFLLFLINGSVTELGSRS